MALVIAGAAAVGDSVAVLFAAVGLLVAIPIALAPALPWRVLLGVLVLVIVFVPIRRYAFAVGLPIQLEPYRIFAALLLAGWGASLLVDNHARLRRTGFEGPMLLVGGAAVISVLANTTRAATVQPEVIKALSFLASFVLLFFLIACVSGKTRDANTILKTLVTGMAVVGVLAVVERRSGWSPFAHLSEIFPLLHETEENQLVRGSGVRARGPAEHPIALGAALVLALPPSLYLARTAQSRKVWWWLAAALLAVGALATLSRTGIFMLVVVVAVFVWLRKHETVRLWPLLLPFLAAIHFALPGTLGSLKASFLPEGGLIASQNAAPGEYDCSSSGRIADIGPAFDQLSTSPLVGIGFGTRIVTGDETTSPPRNACILDNQWLGTLLETGVVGFVAWLWLFACLIRRLGRAARARGPDGELCVALAASIGAYAASMLTFDAFGFIQVTFFLFLLMGLAASTLIRIGTTRRSGLAVT